MGTVGVGLDFCLTVSPNLPASPEAHALPVAENLVVLDVVHLPADQLSVSLEIPLAKPTYATQIADRRITFVPPQVPFLIEKPQNKIVKAVGAVPEEPGAPAHPRPEESVTWPTQTVLSVTVAAVIGSLEPIEPIRKPTIFANETGKNRRQKLRKKLENIGLENYIATKVGMGYMIV